jgi:hypothetical protein
MMDQPDTCSFFATHTLMNCSICKQQSYRSNLNIDSCYFCNKPNGQEEEEQEYEENVNEPHSSILLTEEKMKKKKKKKNTKRNDKKKSSDVIETGLKLLVTKQDKKKNNNGRSTNVHKNTYECKWVALSSCEGYATSSKNEKCFSCKEEHFRRICNNNAKTGCQGYRYGKDTGHLHGKCSSCRPKKSQSSTKPVIETKSPFGSIIPTNNSPDNPIALQDMDSYLVSPNLKTLEPSRLSGYIVSQAEEEERQRIEINEALCVIEKSLESNYDVPTSMIRLLSLCMQPKPIKKTAIYGSFKELNQVIEKEKMMKRKMNDERKELFTQLLHEVNNRMNEKKQQQQSEEQQLEEELHQ